MAPPSKKPRTAGFVMGFSKIEVNLRRLLNAAPQQKNQAKLLHYVATLHEQLEQLVAETTLEGLPRISKTKANDYSEKIDALTAELAAPSSSFSKICQPFLPKFPETVNGAQVHESLYRTEAASAHGSLLPGFRRRFVPQNKVGDTTQEITKSNSSMPIKLDASAKAQIEKHRKLQEDLTDEMVGLAQQLKESSLMMNQSLQDTEKIINSTERAVEHSLASTGHANAWAIEIYSESFKTTCFMWLVIFLMTCIFFTVVLLIRVT